MGTLLDYFFGKKEQVIVPEKPTVEEAWLSSNFALRWIHRLEAWGLTADQYQKARRKKSDEETILTLYKTLVKKNRSKLVVLQSLYYELAMMHAELGKNSAVYLKLAQKSILEYYKKNKNVQSVVIENAGRDACANCKKLDGLMLTLHEAEKKKFLPNQRCIKKHGKTVFCRCMYGPMKNIR